MRRRMAVPGIIGAGLLLASAAVAQQYNPAQGAISGGLVGAGTGAIIGAIAGGGHGAGIGAAVGGGLGAVAGAASTPAPPRRGRITGTTTTTTSSTGTTTTTKPGSGSQPPSDSSSDMPAAGERCSPPGEPPRPWSRHRLERRHLRRPDHRAQHRQVRAVSQAKFFEG
jgi:predicted lipid-binding transport protein (Tim44 family)